MYPVYGKAAGGQLLGMRFLSTTRLEGGQIRALPRSNCFTVRMS